MMNLSEMLESIKMDLGIYGINLPLENADEKMYKVIKLKTLKMYSQYFPLKETYELRLDKLETVRRGNAGEIIARIPDVTNGRRIITVMDVQPGGSLQNSGQMYPDMSMTSNFLNDTILAHAQANLASAVLPPYTFEFENPNIIHLFNYQHYSQHITMLTGIEHYENLSSIPNSQWASFEKLALLDIKSFLYGLLKHHTEFSTQVGNISLKIDDWANAADERKTLLEEWDNVYHLESSAIYFI